MNNDAVKALIAGLSTLPDDAARRAFLGTAYTALVGYDPFEDDPRQTIEEIAELFIGVTVAVVIR